MPTENRGYRNDIPYFFIPGFEHLFETPGGKLPVGNLPACEMGLLPDMNPGYNRDMIGHYEEARSALNGGLPLLSMHGCTRMVYRSDDIVYKVNAFPREDGDVNGFEHVKAEELRATAPEWLVIPQTTLWNVDGENVLAMPFIEGEVTGECESRAFNPDEPCTCLYECLPEHIQGVIQDLHFDAVSYGNILRLLDGRYCVIDLG